MSDLIDRQAAIDDIWTVSPLAHLDREWVDKWLRQLPPANSSEIPNSSDTISRAKAIDICANAIDLWHGHLGEGALVAVREKIAKLPPAQPERIKGRWIESKGQNILLKNLIEKGETWRVCDRCGAGFMIGYQYECDKAYHETFHNFCPKCGADMREVTT